VTDISFMQDQVNSQLPASLDQHTPMMQQYLRLKAEAGPLLLLTAWVTSMKCFMKTLSVVQSC
jgi:DNA mismatch repair ATPase MutS